MIIHFFQCLNQAIGLKIYTRKQTSLHWWNDCYGGYFTIVDPKADYFGIEYNLIFRRYLYCLGFSFIKPKYWINSFKDEYRYYPKQGKRNYENLSFK